MRLLVTHIDLIVSIAVGVCVLALLTDFPQNPDSGEMVVTALNGGVMHPTGFPLQAWINRLLIHLPFGTPAERLSVLNVFAMVGMVWLFLDTLRGQRLSIVAITASTLLLATDTILVSVSLYPEKYTLIVFYIVLLLNLHQRCTDGNGRKNQPKWSYLFALSFGLGIAQQTSILVMSPLLVQVFAVFLARPDLSRKKRTSRALACAALTLFPMALLYGSLVLLRTSSPWVDWGHLESAGDVFRHATRADFKFLQITSEGIDARHIFGIDLFWEYFSEEWHIYLVFPLIGLVLLLKRGLRTSLYLLVSIVATFVLLFIATQTQTPVGLGYMERYLVLTLPWLAFLSALGINWAQDRIRKRRQGHIHTALVLAILGVCIYGLPAKLDYFRKQNNTLFEAYRNILAGTLPDDAVYVTNDDFEIFYGIPDGEGIRFPIFDMTPFPWFRERALPAMAPELLRGVKGRQWDFGTLLHVAHDNGRQIAATDPAALEDLKSRARQRGYLWITQPVVHAADPATLSGDVHRICEALGTVRFPVTRRGSFFQKAVLIKMGRWLKSMSTLLGNRGLEAEGLAMKQLSAAMRPEVSPDTWKTVCQYRQETGTGQHLDGQGTGTRRHIATD